MTPEFPWDAYLFLILPIGLLTVGGVGVLIAWQISWMPSLLRRPNPRPVFDPSQLGDPLAMKTDWTPAKAGGASFRTHKLVRVDPDRLEFRASMGYLLFALAIAVISSLSHHGRLDALLRHCSYRS
jgi:hypothetical protein